MPDYSKMFPKAPAVVGQTTKPVQVKPDTVTSLLEFRDDLSDKVRQHVDLIDKIVRKDFDVITEVNLLLKRIMDEVITFAERNDSMLFKIFNGKPDTTDITTRLDMAISAAENMLKTKGKVDPFTQMEVGKLVDQVDYLIDQLDKACNELEEKKKRISDDFIRDAANRRINTLTSQQQLIVTGAQQIKQLANDITVRPAEVKDYLNGRLPTIKRMCLDVLSGKASISELRKKA